MLGGNVPACPRPVKHTLRIFLLFFASLFRSLEHIPQLIIEKSVTTNLVEFITLWWLFLLGVLLLSRPTFKPASEIPRFSKHHSARSATDNRSTQARKYVTDLDLGYSLVITTRIEYNFTHPERTPVITADGYLPASFV